MPTNYCRCQKTTETAILCGMKIPTVRHLVLSQYICVTDRQTDRQNCDSNTMRCITCSRTVKMPRKTDRPNHSIHLTMRVGLYTCTNK